MNSKTPSTKKIIANYLIAIYKQHEYDVKQENLDLTVIQLSEILKEHQIDDFFNNVSHGLYGVLYRMPTSILSMAQKYKIEPIEKIKYL